MEKQINTYSFSKLKCFFECKYYYYLHYFDSCGMIPQSHGTSEFGSYMHKILEKYGNGSLDIYDLLPYYVDHYDENIVSDFTLRMSETFSKDMGGKYYQNGYDFLRDFNGFDFQIIDTEKQFELEYKGKFRLNGQIDVVAKKDDELIIVDYKSKGNWKNKKERYEYEKQLYIYSWAVKNIYGEYPKKMAFFMFRLNKWSWIDFDIERLNEVMQWVESTVDEIESEIDFLPITQIDGEKFNFYCNNFCDFRNQCKYRQLNN